MSPPLPTTLFKAIKAPNGKIVCVHPDHLLATTKVVRTLRDYEVAIGQGWAEHPDEALARLEAAEDDISLAAAVSAADDRRMSLPAQAEVADYGSDTIEHVLEIPEVSKRKPGRPRKVQT